MKITKDSIKWYLAILVKCTAYGYENFNVGEIYELVDSSPFPLILSVKDDSGKICSVYSGDFLVVNR